MGRQGLENSLAALWVLVRCDEPCRLVVAPEPCRFFFGQGIAVDNDPITGFDDAGGGGQFLAVDLDPALFDPAFGLAP